MYAGNLLPHVCRNFLFHSFDHFWLVFLLHVMGFFQRKEINLYWHILPVYFFNLLLAILFSHIWNRQKFKIFI